MQIVRGHRCTIGEKKRYQHVHDPSRCLVRTGPGGGHAAEATCYVFRLMSDHLPIEIITVLVLSSFLVVHVLLTICLTNQRIIKKFASGIRLVLLTGPRSNNNPTPSVAFLNGPHETRGPFGAVLDGEGVYPVVLGGGEGGAAVTARGVVFRHVRQIGY